MTIDPRSFISNIDRGGDGVWRTNVQSSVSYPAEGHDACHGVEDGSFWFAHRNRCIAATLRRHPPFPGMPFVDVGGGNGFVGEMIKRMGHDVVLVEPGTAGIVNASHRGIDTLVQASLIDLDVRPGSLGGIGLFDVIEHIEDDSNALRTMHDMLAEEGRVYATVPAHRWLWSSVDVEAGHFRRYTVRGLRRLFHDSGFEVDFCSYYFWALPAPMFVFRTLPELLHLRRRPRQRQKRVHSEHRGDSALDVLLAMECARLEKGKTVPVGASCLIVGKRRRPQ